LCSRGNILTWLPGASLQDIRSGLRHINSRRGGCELVSAQFGDQKLVYSENLKNKSNLLQRFRARGNPEVEEKAGPESNVLLGNPLRGPSRLSASTVGGSSISGHQKKIVGLVKGYQTKDRFTWRKAILPNRQPLNTKRLRFKSGISSRSLFESP